MCARAVTLIFVQVATYQTKEGGEAEEEDVEIIKADMDSTDPAYWEKLLRYSFSIYSTSTTFYGSIVCDIVFIVGVL